MVFFEYMKRHVRITGFVVLLAFFSGSYFTSAQTFQPTFSNQDPQLDDIFQGIQSGGGGATGNFNIPSFDLSQTEIPDLSNMIDAIAPGTNVIFSGPSVNVIPSYPEPYEDFRVELDLTGRRFDGASVSWLVDGVEQPLARNQRTVELTAGALGEPMEVRADLVLNDGSTDSFSLTVRPIQIDIVVEGLTTVPDFYQGRPLPSVSSDARATAVIHTGAPLDRKNLSYRWEVDNEVTNQGTIRGLQSTQFEMPRGRETLLKVTVMDGSTQIGERTIKINPARPEILFYENNPLYGVNERPFFDGTTIVGNQVTIQAEPYHIPPFVGNPDYLVEWRVGGRVIENANALDPTLTTLRGSGSQSGSNVSLRMADLSVLSEPVQGSFYVNFGQ